MSKLPKYRKLSKRNKGFVEHRGKRIYLPGKFNSHESRTAYAKLIENLLKLEEEGVGKVNLEKIGNIPISLLCVQFLDWAKMRYVKHGRSTGSYERFRDSIVPVLVETSGDIPTSEFGPLALKRVRDVIVKTGISRNEVNRRVSHVKRIFSWDVENELVPVTIADALKYVRSLHESETTAHETKPVTFVSSKVIDTTLPHLAPPVADMARIQYYSGCRPSEVCNLRREDVDQSDDIWIYTPWEYKTEHFTKQRQIPLLPDAQAVLERYRNRPADEFIFSPKETMRIIFEIRRASRKTPVQPCQIKRAEKVKRHPKLRLGTHYSTRAYNYAIRRACKKASVPKWSPNMLRHAFATYVRGRVII
jgi:integrase